jgi:anti-sigma B factor antagonist
MNTIHDGAELYVVRVTGRVDALTAPQLDEQLRALSTAAGQKIVVDLTQATYLSSSGLRILLLALKRQRSAGGQLLLHNPPPRIQQVIRLAGLDRFFPLYSEPLPQKASPAHLQG